LRLDKRISAFVKKIGNPEDSKSKNVLNFLSFLFSPAGFRLTKDKIIKHLLRGDRTNPRSYNKWISRRLSKKGLKERYESNIGKLTATPLISIIMPVYNPAVRFLREAIDSVISQQYIHWELCISDDRSPEPEIATLLKEFADKDARIKFIIRNTNGHISANSNSALALATGDFYLFMDHDDLLTPNCLFELALYINEHKDIKIIYSDEDKINDNGIYSEPHFKPDWAPDNLLSRNYIGHVTVIAQDVVNELNGFREGFDGSQDYDLILRATELTNKIGHIPKVLYHWRIHEQSVSANGDAKPYAYIAARKAITEALIRRGTPAVVEDIPNLIGAYRIKYTNIDAARVSIIIPSKDQASLLKKTIDSILKKTNHPDYEIVLLNNNSTSKDFFDLVSKYNSALGSKFKCIDANFPFNFSRLMNLGVANSSGKYLLFLNNDIEVIHAGWMQQMVSFAQRKYTGAVGVKLLYPNNLIQHAGVVLGFGGAAKHVFINHHRKSAGYFNYALSLNNYSAVTAACMMCRREIFDEAGGFDESLSVEYNDIDFCLKLLERGYYNVYTPDVELYHYESATRGHPLRSKAGYTQHVKDQAIFRSKWLKYIEADPFYNPNLSLIYEFSVNIK